ECSCIPEEDRKAHYVCALVLARNGEEVFSCEGTCDGRIILEARGKNGFGYDPYFFLDDYGITFGEMDPDIKNRISHRANALSAFKRFVEEN
ncbi:MAG: non-canonical purine NTP pyrophosphatase, partial [Clostridia bacterium]|nr:non-canonical purine NTP pyrophosphatase [Clostridia bacterium]